MEEHTEAAQLVENQEDQREFEKYVNLAAPNIVNKDSKPFEDNFTKDEWNYYD